MKKRILTAAAAFLLLLGGCRSESEPTVAEAPQDIEEQTVPADDSENDADSAETDEPDGNWVSDLFGSIIDKSRDPLAGSIVQTMPQIQQDTEPPVDPTTFYTLTVDETGLVTRTEGPFEEDDNLTWVIETDGYIRLERNAENEFSYRPMDYGPGTYRIWLKAWFQGYQTVSNTIEFEGPPSGYIPREQEIDGFESWRIADTKGHMKHLIQCIRERYGQPEYKMGFVIDPDHDGFCNGIVYCAGVGEYGEEVQYLYDNESNWIRFGSSDYLLQANIKCKLAIWCNSGNGKDYIVRIEADGSAYDCCTEEYLPDFPGEDACFIFNSSDPSDRDHFIVSYKGIPEFEDA